MTTVKEIKTSKKRIYTISNLKSNQFNYLVAIIASLKIKITDQDGLNDATNDTKVFVGNIDNAAANKNQLNRIIIEFAITAVKD